MNLHKAEDETCLQLVQSDADLSAMISIAIRYNSLLISVDVTYCAYRYIVYINIYL